MKDLFIQFLKEHNAFEAYKTNIATLNGNLSLDMLLESGELSGAFHWAASPENEDYWDNLDRMWQTASETTRVLRCLSSIAKTYGIIEFIKVESGDELCEANGEDSYINRSACAGCDRIELGIYDNIDLLIVSFFHELGHITNTDVDRESLTSHDIERLAWETGYALAETHGFQITDEAIKWADVQLATYEDADERAFIDNKNNEQKQ